jgi:hypothetical protein
MLSIVSSLTSGCTPHGDFDNRWQFQSYIDKFSLVGIGVAEAKRRLTDVGFRCYAGGQQQIQCDRTRRRWYWLGYEGQLVMLTYDQDQVVTSVSALWGHYMS